MQTRLQKLLVALVLAILVPLMIYHWYQRNKAINEYFMDNSSQVEDTIPPVFVWRYATSTERNPDGIPKTIVYLEVTYPNETPTRKLIDTTDGSCNDLPDSEADVAPYSTLIQCYYAGLGFKFKVVKIGSTYKVMRKQFEEGAPNQTPSNYPYETIIEFSHAK